MKRFNRAKRDYLLRCVKYVRILESLAGPRWDEQGPPRYFDRQGRPIRMREWAALFECFPQEYKCVRYTRVNGVRVSTVWLGLDHGFGRVRAIFETMVFGTRQGEELDVERYATEAEAIAGHVEMVEKWRTPQPTQPEGSA